MISIKEIVLKVNPIPRLYRKKHVRKLNNSDFTIFSSNCMGGIISHLLNKQFLSPTVNLRMDSKSFIKFVSNIHYYLSLPINIIDNTDYPFPVGKLDDVVILFNHYRTEEEALNKWEARKKRINWNNVFILTNDLDGVTKEDILSLKNIPCKNLMVFTHEEYPDIPYTYYVGSKKRIENMMNKNLLTGLYEFERWFDYSKWLNNCL